MSAYDTGYDPVYGNLSREELALLANQGGARRRAIERELREREAANVAANLAAADSEFEMEPELTSPVYRRAPGPVGYGTGESEAGEDIYSPEEAAAYRYRKPTAAAGLPVAATPDEVAAAMNPGGPYRGGEYLPSQEDAAMYARGLVHNVNPRTGAAGYSVAYPGAEAAGTIGAPGRLGARQDLRQPVRDVRTGQLIPDTHKYDKDVADSPLGQVEVYRPSPEFRQQLDAQEHRKRVERLGRAAGMDGAAVVALASGEEPVDLEALRSAGRQRREDDRNVRQAEVTRRAMERQNPTALLNDEWRQFVIANKLLGGKRAGASPSDVALGREQADAAMQARMGFGRDQRPSPAQENLVNTQAEAARRATTDPRELASSAVAAGQFNHSDVFNYADNLVHSAYSSRPGMLGVSSRFTDNEVRLGAERLRDDLGMPLEEAERIMRRIQQDRNNSSVASSVIGSFYDR